MTDELRLSWVSRRFPARLYLGVSCSKWEEEYTALTWEKTLPMCLIVISLHVSLLGKDSHGVKQFKPCIFSSRQYQLAGSSSIFFHSHVPVNSSSFIEYFERRICGRMTKMHTFNACKKINFAVTETPRGFPLREDLLPSSSRLISTSLSAMYVGVVLNILCSQAIRIVFSACSRRFVLKLQRIS
jgi:hypothetical protein